MADQEGLTVRSLLVRFGGVVALESVDLDVAPAEIVGLIGPNGAGKSTLVNCVGGQLRPTAGSIGLSGRALDGRPPFRRARMGIGRTFQRVALFPELTVSAHLLLALRADRTRRPRWTELIEPARPDDHEVLAIHEMLELTGLESRAEALVSTLPLGACRLLEVGRALIGRPSILLADEPSSGLDPREAATLSELLRAVRSRGVGVLLVEHDLGVVAGVCDRVIALDLGRVIAQGAFGSVMADPAVRRAYLGQVA